MGGIIRSHKKLIWAIALGVATYAALAIIPNSLRTTTRVLIAWDVTTVSFAAIVFSIAVGLTPEHLKKHAAEQDEGRLLVLGVSTASAAASMVAIWQELGAAKEQGGAAQGVMVGLAFLTVALSWLFAHLVFATHYAHEYYAPNESDTKSEGLDFPGAADEKPDFWEFLHFSLVIGVANQTADVQIRARGIRRVVTIHGIVAFLFNTVILAMSINFAASLFGN